MRVSKRYKPPGRSKCSGGAIKPPKTNAQTTNNIRQLPPRFALIPEGAYRYGFPIDGTRMNGWRDMDLTIPRRSHRPKGVYAKRGSPLGESNSANCADHARLFASNAARFRARAPRAVSRRATALLKEATNQVREGWLDPPGPLD